MVARRRVRVGAEVDESVRLALHLEGVVIHQLARVPMCALHVAEGQVAVEVRKPPHGPPDPRKLPRPQRCAEVPLQMLQLHRDRAR
eukprot:4970291-Pyramimonas_sp.AAC.1